MNLVSMRIKVQSDIFQLVMQGNGVSRKMEKKKKLTSTVKIYAKDEDKLRQ